MDFRSRTGFLSLATLLMAAPLTAVLLGSGPVTVAMDDPPTDNCECIASDDCQTYSCQGLVSSFCYTEVLKNGQCNNEECPEEGTHCKFRYELDLLLNDPLADIHVTVNGVSIIRTRGEFDMERREKSLACGNQETIALLAGSTPCVEAFFDCKQCKAILPQ